jgi:hypothetical protein
LPVKYLPLLLSSPPAKLPEGRRNAPVLMTSLDPNLTFGGVRRIGVPDPDGVKLLWVVVLSDCIGRSYAEHRNGCGSNYTLITPAVTRPTFSRGSQIPFGAATVLRVVPGVAELLEAPLRLGLLLSC